ncbi:hypothetical protein [Methylomonas sp. LWB]|uniref:hypothetical protein n=1 Tax=Methylomonas sp. LWB TaxID=1905845 RepID=UPI00111520B9|nr:hypothetical protein [Methylomonas sp. LWB]
MDILGYSELIVQSQNTGTQQTVLRDLHKALSESRRRLEGHDLPIEFRKLGKKDFFALKAFTDNIAIGWPVHSDAEVELGSACMKLAYFQFEMAIQGYFVRGGISLALAYIDEVAVFGDALTEAYHGESKLARDPRIILTQSAVTAAKKHLDFYSKPSFSPHVRFLLKDADGQWFLNYLHSVLIAEYENGPFYSEFLRHKAAVEVKLAEHSANPSVWAKYAWVANYHNYFCDLHSKYFDEKHCVNVELFKSPPSLIVDED